MKDYKRFWDCVYVINLEHRTDRWESISKLADEAGLEINRWDAFKSVDVDLEKHRIGVRVKKQSCVACSLSHIGIYRDALSKGYDRILVLEDDADIPADLYKKVETFFNENSMDHLEYDLIYLGGADKYPPAQLYDTLAISQYTLLTHAMLFSKEGMEKVIEITDNQDEGKCRMSIDVFLAENIQSLNQTYQVVPSIIKTIASHSDIAGWKRTWDSVLKDCRNQGLKNPKKWSHFEERAKTLIKNKQLVK
jgi:GR25 family glycosyltransferase involved in LPS biosynthesis